MTKINITILKDRLDSLAVFRNVTDDGVLFTLSLFLDDPCKAAYSQFVAELYLNGGNITRHVLDIIKRDDNVFVRALAKGDVPDKVVRDAADKELDTLLIVASLTKKDLCEGFDADYLPDFVTEDIDIKQEYYAYVKNIKKTGYGIFAGHSAFYLSDGDIVPVKNPDPVRLSDFVEYDRERKIVVDNTLALLSGKPAANVLLTGDAGTGKSSTVKAIGNEFASQGLRIIEINKDQLRSIPRLMDDLSDDPLKFILFIDDLSFNGDDDNYNALKAVLEGSVSAKSNNVVVYATSNRRHIVKEKFSDREGDDVHRNDAMQEIISLSERFGLHVSFYKPDKATYLSIVNALAKEAGIKMNKSDIEAQAERFALERGGRSARIAKQFVDVLLAK